MLLRGGRPVEAHVPNPGRLTGVLAPRCRVLLDGPHPPGRALAYTMVAAKAGAAWVGTNTIYANRVFPRSSRAACSQSSTRRRCGPRLRMADRASTSG